MHKHLFCAFLTPILFWMACIATATGGERSSLAPSSGSVGMGPIVLPDYQGSSTYRVLFLPMIDARWGDRVSFNVARGLRVKLGSLGSLSTGVVVRYLGGRSDRGAISRLDDVSGGAAAGATLGYQAGPMRLQGEILTTFTGDVSGSELRLSALWGGSFGANRWIYSIGPSVIWMSDNKANRLFGLDEGEAAMLGVDAYRATSGVANTRLVATLIHRVSRNWTLSGFLSIGCLQGDAAASPLVDELGRREQGIAGAVISRRF